MEQPEYICVSVCLNSIFYLFNASFIFKDFGLKR